MLLAILQEGEGVAVRKLVAQGAEVNLWIELVIDHLKSSNAADLQLSSGEDADAKSGEIANLQQSFENRENEKMDDLIVAQKRVVTLKVIREMKVKLKTKCHAI